MKHFTSARPSFGVLGLLSLLPLVAGATRSSSADHDPVVQAVQHPERPEADLARDGTRRPARMLDFFDIKPGQAVADIQAGDGYYTELLARVVGEEGRVYSVNNKTLLGFVGERFAARLAREGFPAKNVVRLDNELSDMGLPKDLDRVLLIRFYHDFGWMEVDRKAFNTDVFESLRPGGIYGVVDHRAKEGAGMTEGQRLHRVEASLVVEEIEAAGFVLEAESFALRDPSDPRDFNIFDDNATRRDRTDRFVYLFRKPE